jgi:hypothetical protein
VDVRHENGARCRRTMAQWARAECVRWENAVEPFEGNRSERHQSGLGGDHHIDVRAITDLFSQDSFDTIVFDPRSIRHKPTTTTVECTIDSVGLPAGRSPLSFVLEDSSLSAAGTITVPHSPTIADDEKNVTGIGVVPATSRCFSPLIGVRHDKRRDNRSRGSSSPA